MIAFFFIIFFNYHYPPGKGSIIVFFFSINIKIFTTNLLKIKFTFCKFFGTTKSKKNKRTSQKTDLKIRKKKKGLKRTKGFERRDKNRNKKNCPVMCCKNFMFIYIMEVNARW